MKKRGRIDSDYYQNITSSQMVKPQAYEADYYVDNFQQPHDEYKPKRQPLVHSLYKPNAEQDRTVYFAEDPYFNQVSFSQNQQQRYAKQPTSKKQRHRKPIALLSLIVVLVISLIFIILYKRLLPKTLHSDSFSLFDIKTGLDTYKDGESRQLPLANIGAIKLTDEQAARMIDLKQDPSEENAKHNLTILAEVDKRANELMQEADKLPPNMLLMAAKNEAFNFVYNYLHLPESSILKDSESVSKPGASSLGNYTLPAGKVLSVPYYLQWDERWGYKPYAGSIIGTYGCGVTCMASVIGYLTNDETILPDKMAELSTLLNTNHEGTDTSFIPLAAQKYGFKTEGTQILETNIKSAIDRKRVVVINVGKGDFTSGGHYILVVGYTEHGDFIIYDPFSPYHTSLTWSIAQLQQQQAKACWSIY